MMNSDLSLPEYKGLQSNNKSDLKQNPFSQEFKQKNELKSFQDKFNAIDQKFPSPPQNDF